jgi:hypothetical protein
MTKPVLSHAVSLAIHVGRAMVVRHVPGAHGPHLYTEAGDACGVWHAGMHVCPEKQRRPPGSMTSRNSDAVSTGSLGSGTKPVTRTV